MADLADEARVASMLWNYRSDPPQRFTANYRKYLSLGGVVHLDEFLRRYLAGDSGNGGDMSRFYFFCLVLDHIVKEGLAGDIAELGVYKGGTATLLATFARSLGRTAYLFDTFDGFDPVDFSGVDAGMPMQFKDTSLAAVRAMVGEENVTYVKGHFPASASAMPKDATFCIVHLDCDLHAPMRDALEYFYPRLVPGGFMIVHDYSSLAWGGPERAVDEFLSDKTETVVPLTDNCGSIAFRKARNPTTDIHWMARDGVALAQGEWREAANGALRTMLHKGWSAPENWGVWGVGEIHELRLFVPMPVDKDFQLNADVSTALIGVRTEQEIDVILEGRTLATWKFNLTENRAVRLVTLPASAAVVSRSNVATFKVEFRPRSIESPETLDPGNKDNRPLGLALNRIQLRPLAKIV